MKTETNKPFISYIIITYNQQKYIKEAIESALAQDYSPMEIIISDDNSSDNTWKVVNEVVANYNGHHRIILNRNTKNIGISEHLNKAMSMAKGELFVMAAGDDIAYPHKTSTFVKHWLSNPSKILALSAGSDNFYDNGETRNKTIFKNTGLDTNPALKIIEKGNWNGCCVAISKKLYDVFGPMNYNATDRTWFYRAAYLGGIYRINDILIKYRLSGISQTSENIDKFIYKEIYMCKSRFGCIEQLKEDLFKYPKIKKDFQKYIRKTYIKCFSEKSILSKNSSFFNRFLGLCYLIKNKQITRFINNVIALLKISLDNEKQTKYYQQRNNILEKIYIIVNKVKIESHLSKIKRGLLQIF